MADLAVCDSVTDCDVSQPVTVPQIVEVEKLCRLPAAMRAATKGSLIPMDKGLHLYPPDWATPALAAMEADRCVGVLCLTYDEEESTARVDLAWCDPDRPAALLALLVRLRRVALAKGLRFVRFTAHTANDSMAKAGKAVGAELFTVGYRVDLQKDAV